MSVNARPDSRALASEIVAAHLTSAPVDVVEIVSALGLELGYEDMGDLSGKIEKRGDTYKITVNMRDPRVRQRFTIAHEIGHYILHRDMIGDGITDDAMYRSSLGNFFETQANQYAAYVLMPPALFKSVYKNTKSFPGLAKIFDVSAQAAEIRAKNLGVGA